MGLRDQLPREPRFSCYSRFPQVSEFLPTQAQSLLPDSDVHFPQVMAKVIY